MRIGFLSDLHIDHNTSMMEQSLQAIISAVQETGVDKLFIAGDTSNNYKTTFELVDNLRENGIETYTIFGNHEYWSLTYEKAQALDNPNYISGETIVLDDNNVVVAIDGFFDYSFVTEVENLVNLRMPKDKFTLTSMGKRHFDLKRSKITEYEEVFNSMHARLIEMLEEHKDKNIILMTHYVPHPDFVIYGDDSIWNANNLFMGSVKYGELAEKYGVSQVIFGHTHTKWHKTINNVEYICNPVGYKNMEYDGVFSERVEDSLTVIEI